MEITLSIRKENVMREVAVTTAYTGGKMDKDENALDRISTVDEDESHLERFWDESRADLSQELLELVTFEGLRNETDYEVRLNVSKSFEDALLPSMNKSLYSFFRPQYLCKVVCVH